MVPCNSGKEVALDFFQISSRISYGKLFYHTEHATEYYTNIGSEKDAFKFST